MDHELEEMSNEEADQKSIGERTPWWELMVSKIIAKCGRITVV
jgi:hypothetical protein